MAKMSTTTALAGSGSVRAAISTGLISASAASVQPGDGKVEQFGDAEDFRRWLSARDLPDADAAGARELREALIDVLRAHSAPGLAADRRQEIEEQARRITALHPVVPVVEAGGVRLHPAQPGVFGEVLAGVAELSLSAACGSKAAMRAYRERKKSAGD